VRYLVKMRRIPIRQIAVFAQTDDLGDAGVAKAYRAMGLNDSAILRLNDPSQYRRGRRDIRARPLRTHRLEKDLGHARRKRPFPGGRPRIGG